MQAVKRATSREVSKEREHIVMACDQQAVIGVLLDRCQRARGPRRVHVV